MLFIKILIVLLIICLILILYFKHKSTNHFTINYKREHCIPSKDCDEGEHCCFFKGMIDYTEFESPEVTPQEEDISLLETELETELVTELVAETTAATTAAAEAKTAATTAVAGPIICSPSNRCPEVLPICCMGASKDQPQICRKEIKDCLGYGHNSQSAYLEHPESAESKEAARKAAATK